MDYLPETCAGCETPITPAVGQYYCEPCVSQQKKEGAGELEAFDAYHRWADSIGKPATPR